MPRPRPIGDRFWEKVEQRPNGCLVWIGGRGAANRHPIYGMFAIGVGRFVNAHRMAWQLAGRELPPRLENLCGDTLCVNVDHWEDARQRETC